jgi:hypothetical protein
MADPLRPNKGYDHDSYTNFMYRLDEAQAELSAALAACRGPRKRLKDLEQEIVAAGINLVAFRRAREDCDLPSAVREQIMQQHHQMMIWNRRPISFQADMFEAPPAERTKAELDRIGRAGYDAGRGGRKSDDNPHRAGTEEHALWHNAHKTGYDSFLAEQKRLAESLAGKKSAKGKPAAAPAAPTGERRGRGRPPGSRNKPKGETAPPAAGTAAAANGVDHQHVGEDGTPNGAATGVPSGGEGSEAGDKF